MIGRSTRKVEGGKLLSVEIVFDQTINRIEITGDFFIHPEEKLQDIEQALVGINIDENEAMITDLIRQTVVSKKIEMIGVTPEGIAAAVEEALKCSGD
ncbi:MAG: lipoate protein ligase C-terminal domain-containing protein [archaeon]